MRQHRLTLAFVSALVLFGVFSGPWPLAGAEVKLWEQSITLPTYDVAPPDPNPRFYQGRTYQGARATFYPYPVMDRLTEKKGDKTYHAVYLENDYVQISVLPELGGRIFSAVDKSNGYDFFYRQHVIKPALIGMLGAWISGGVEWNVPHHHRASSFMPVDHTTVSNADGSKTLLVGETELRHGLKWLVGLTLFPDRSYIEMSMKVFNRTPLAHPILFWINPAVHANEQYQVLFPPGTEWAVQHGKPEFASWPISHQTYGGTDYTRGVDISWWKNHPSPVSFFAWNCEEDWFGGYDHGRKAGVIQFSDHHMAPGKKFFEWGNGPEGEMWSDVLSDGDGPYLELMAGAWSDNQPDYSWLQPGEVREWKHWWYPIRDIGGVKAANREAAINCEVRLGAVDIAVNATKPLMGELRVEAGGKLVSQQSIVVAPPVPFSTHIPLGAEFEPEQVRVSLRDGAGKELLAYQPAKPKATPMPKPVQRPKSPKEYTTVDELYYTGQRVEQLYSPAFEATPFYEEILRRDPGEYRANTALGIVLCRQWRWAEAADHLSNAVARATANYVRPKDGEAFYYLGVALEAERHAEEAGEAYFKAAWSQGWQAPAYYALAQLETAQTHFERALELVDRSLNAGSRNTKAIDLKVTLLRKLGRPADAQDLARAALEVDPLDFRALNELALSKQATGQGTEADQAGARLGELLRGEVQSSLGLALEYASQGCWSEAKQLLQATTLHDPAHVYPMVYYALAHFALRSGHQDDAGKLYQLASQMPPDYCFPGRFEEAVILRTALQENQRDARAAHYLGNALYDQQPAEAIRFWEKARELDPSFALVHRNLGLAYAQHEKNTAKAVASLEKAVELNPIDPRFFYELDVQSEGQGDPVAKRLDRLQSHRAIVELRDDATARFIVLLTAAGQADDAVQLLARRHFHNWEGSGELHDIYVNACSQRGLERLRAGRAAEALSDFESALLYPRNQEVGRSKREQRVAEIYYQIGTAQEALGDQDKATAAFKKAANSTERAPSPGQFWKALALAKVGKKDAASRIFNGLVEHGLAELERTSDAVDYFAKFGEKRSDRARQADAHYLAGLGWQGQDKQEEAKAHFAKALELHPAHLGALTATRAQQSAQ